jgi:hypothetical protein
MGFDPLAFVGLYLLIGALIGSAVVIAYGDEIIPAIQIMARAEGLELEHSTIVWALLILFAIKWPALIGKKGSNG